VDHPGLRQQPRMVPSFAIVISLINPPISHISHFYQIWCSIFRINWNVCGTIWNNLEHGRVTVYFGNFLFWNFYFCAKLIYKVISLKGISILRLNSIVGIEKSLAKNSKMYGNKISIGNIFVIWKFCNIKVGIFGIYLENATNLIPIPNLKKDNFEGFLPCNTLKIDFVMELIFSVIIIWNGLIN